MIGGLLLSAYNYELGHWGVFYIFQKINHRAAGIKLAKEYKSQVDNIWKRW